RGPAGRHLRYAVAGLAGDRGEPRLPHIPRPGGRPHHRAVAGRLAAGGAGGRGGPVARPPVPLRVRGLAGHAGAARAGAGPAGVGGAARRRYDALRGSALGRLPATELTRLAADARWVRPRTGEQLVFAGAAQPSVFVVVDGALEGRRPGDPSGLVRERVGAGG